MDIDLRKKNWLVPFVREVYARLDLGQVEHIRTMCADSSFAERFETWRLATLRKRGLLTGSPELAWPKPSGGLPAKKRTEWVMLNTLCHQIEMLFELRYLYELGHEGLEDQLDVLMVLAASVEELDAAETLYELGLDEWGDADDKRRKKLAKAMGPAVRAVGNELKDAGLKTVDEPMLNLPFQHVLTYAETNQMLAIANHHFGLGGRRRLDEGETRRILAHGYMEKLYLLEAVIAMAKADGTISSVERRLIQHVVDMARLPDEEQDQVWQSLDSHIDPVKIAVAIDDKLTRRFIYEQLVLHSYFEGEPNPKERAFLETFGEALGIDKEQQLAVQAEQLLYLESNPEIVHAFSLSGVMRRVRVNMSQRVEDVVKLNLGRIVTEIKETGELAQLLVKRSKGQLTPEEEAKVRSQLADILKTIPALGLFAVPGGSLLLPIVIKLLPFDVLPSAFNEEDESL